MEKNRIEMSREYCGYAATYADIEKDYHISKAEQLAQDLNELKGKLYEAEPNDVDSIKSKIESVTSNLARCESIADKTAHLKSLNNSYEQLITKYQDSTMSDADYERLDRALDSIDKESLIVAKELYADKRDLSQNGVYERFAVIHSITSFLKHPSAMGLIRIGLNVKHLVEYSRVTGLDVGNSKWDKWEDVKAYRVNDYRSRLESMKPQFALPQQNYEKLAKEAYQYSKHLAHYESREEQKARIKGMTAELDGYKVSIGQMKAQGSEVMSSDIVRLENQIFGCEAILKGLGYEESDTVDDKNVSDYQDSYEKETAVERAIDSLEIKNPLEERNLEKDKESEEQKEIEKDVQEKEQEAEERKEMDSEAKEEKESDDNTDKENEKDSDTEKDSEQEKYDEKSEDSDNQEESEKDNNEDKSESEKETSESDQEIEKDSEEPSDEKDSENKEGDDNEEKVEADKDLDKKEGDEQEKDNKEESDKENKEDQNEEDKEEKEGKEDADKDTEKDKEENEDDEEDEEDDEDEEEDEDDEENEDDDEDKENDENDKEDEDDEVDEDEKDNEEREKDDEEDDEEDSDEEENDKESENDSNEGADNQEDTDSDAETDIIESDDIDIDTDSQEKEPEMEAEADKSDSEEKSPDSEEAENDSADVSESDIRFDDNEPQEVDKVETELSDAAEPTDNSDISVPDELDETDKEEITADNSPDTQAENEANYDAESNIDSENAPIISMDIADNMPEEMQNPEDMGEQDSTEDKGAPDSNEGIKESIVSNPAETMRDTYNASKIIGNMFSDPLQGLKNDMSRLATHNVLGIIQEKLAVSGGGAVASGASKALSVLTRLTAPGPLLAIKIGIELGVIFGSGLGAFVDELLDDLEDSGFFASITSASIPDYETFCKEVKYISDTLSEETDVGEGDSETEVSDTINAESVIDGLKDLCDFAMDNESYENLLDGGLMASFELGYDEADIDTTSASDARQIASSEETDAEEHEGVSDSADDKSRSSDELSERFSEGIEIAQGVSSYEADTFFGDDSLYTNLSFILDNPTYEVDDYIEGEENDYRDANNDYEDVFATNMNGYSAFSDDFTEDQYVLLQEGIGDAAYQDDITNEMQRQLAEQEMRNDIDRQEIEREMTRLNAATYSESDTSSSLDK